MNLEVEILSIRRTQERIDSKLTALLNKPVKESWCKVSFVTRLTNWTKEDLRAAREQGLIKFRRAKTGGYEYQIESIPEQFLKKVS